MRYLCVSSRMANNRLADLLHDCVEYLAPAILSFYAYSKDKRGSVELFAEMKHNYNYLSKR